MPFQYGGGGSGIYGKGDLNFDISFSVDDKTLKAASKELSQFVNYGKQLTYSFNPGAKQAAFFNKQIKEGTKQLQLGNEKIEQLADITKLGTSSYKGFAAGQKQVAIGQKELQKQVSMGTRKLREMLNEEKRFKFAGLNYLFFGMMVDRIFSGIRKSSTQTFREVTEATYGTITNVGQVAAGFEFLKFTVGDAINTALEPLMPLISGIIDSMADWIQQNPELAATGIILGEVLGKFFEYGGAIKVFLENAKLVRDAFKGIKDIAGSLSDIKLGVLWKNLEGTKDTFMAWFDKLPKNLKIVTEISVIVALAFIVHEGLQYTIKGFAKFVADNLDENIKKELKPIFLEFGFGNLDQIADAIERILTSPVGLVGGGIIEVLRSIALTLGKAAFAPRQGDFVMRGNKVVPFSSEDTIIGAKNPNMGGNTFNINVNVTSTDNPRNDGRIIGDAIVSRISNMTSSASTIR